jgi:hypothetical protein
MALKELTKTAKNICDMIIPTQIHIHMCIICVVKLAGFTNILWSSFLIFLHKICVGQDSSARVATCYGLDGPGIESGRGREFPYPSRPALGSTQSPIQWVPGLSRGQSGRGVMLTTHPHLALRLKSRAVPVLPLWGFVACYGVNFTS